jgi:hypothetical protein
MSQFAYRTLINKTLQTTIDRAKNYRNLIVGLVALGAVSIIIAITYGPLLFFALALLLFPLCALFYVMDARTLMRWQSSVLSGWTDGHIELSAFRAAVKAVPGLPANTLAGMLELLPSTSDLAAAHAVSTKTREAAAAVATGVQARRLDGVILKTLGSALAASAVVIAASLRTWTPLLLAVAVLPLCGIAAAAARMRVRQIKVCLDAARLDASFDPAAFALMLSSYDWRPFSLADKDNILLMRPVINTE